MAHKQQVIPFTPLAPFGQPYPSAYPGRTEPQTPLPQPSSGGTGGLQTIEKVPGKSKKRPLDFNPPQGYDPSPRIRDFDGGIQQDRQGQQRERGVFVGSQNRMRVGQTPMYNDGPIPFKIPRFFKTAISSWDGLTQRGARQSNFTLNIKKPIIPRGTTNARSVSGIAARQMGAGRMRVPAIYVPTSIS